MIDTLISYTTQDWFPLAVAVIAKAPRLVRMLARLAGVLVRLVRGKAKARGERRAVDRGRRNDSN